MPRWTPEARAKQADLIHRWQPWTSSTGPLSPTGKALVARNADKGMAAKRRERRRLYAGAKYLLLKYELCQCESADWARAVKTGRIDLFEKKHFAAIPPGLGLEPSAVTLAEMEAAIRELMPLDKQTPAQ